MRMSRNKAWKSQVVAWTLAILIVLLGCEKQGPSASMSDEEILRVIGLDPAQMQSERHRGADGSSIDYNDERNEVTITRSFVSGVTVLQFRPKQREWKLGHP